MSLHNSYSRIIIALERLLPIAIAQRVNQILEAQRSSNNLT
jgi:hypothetical protein